MWFQQKHTQIHSIWPRTFRRLGVHSSSSQNEIRHDYTLHQTLEVTPRTSWQTSKSGPWMDTISSRNPETNSGNKCSFTACTRLIHHHHQILPQPHRGETTHFSPILPPTTKITRLHIDGQSNTPIIHDSPTSMHQCSPTIPTSYLHQWDKQHSRNPFSTISIISHLWLYLQPDHQYSEAATPRTKSYYNLEQVFILTHIRTPPTATQQTPRRLDSAT